MSYNKRVWTNGDILDANALNKFENALYELSQSESEATNADCDALFDGFLDDSWMPHPEPIPEPVYEEGN